MNFFKYFYVILFLLFTNIVLSSSSDYCDPVKVFKELKRGRDYLPFKVENLDHTKLNLVTDFINSEARRTGKLPKDIIQALKRIEESGVNTTLSKTEFQTRLDQELIQSLHGNNAGQKIQHALTASQIDELRNILPPDKFDELFDTFGTSDLSVINNVLSLPIHERALILNALDPVYLRTFSRLLDSDQIMSLLKKLPSQTIGTNAKSLPQTEIDLLKALLDNSSKSFKVRADEIAALKNILTKEKFETLFYQISDSEIQYMFNIDPITRSKLVQQLSPEELRDILKTFSETREASLIAKIQKQKGLRPKYSSKPIKYEQQVRWSNSGTVLVADNRVTGITPVRRNSVTKLPTGVDLNTEIPIRYPDLTLDFNLIDNNKLYLRSEEFTKRFGPEITPNPNSIISPQDVGTSIGSGSFKDAYVSKDGSHVIKILKNPKIKPNKTNGMVKTAKEIAEETRIRQLNLMLSIRRELAIEDFLVAVEQRYIAARKKPPFKVLKINRDPELLKRGIIIQEVAEGKSLVDVSRAEFDNMVPKKDFHYEPPLAIKQQETIPLHKEVVDRIPEAQEIMAIFDRFEDSIHQANTAFYSERSLGGYISYVDNTGKLIDNPNHTQRFMAVDYGVRFKNLAFTPGGDPPFEFFDW
ncbi:MAG: hypothetical protein HOJ35_10650 [Bdellovibrionales bacterium]|nr:hypothetical protein [Bdellovibrionales bacterium]